jgi:hypothetical protein
MRTRQDGGDEALPREPVIDEGADLGEIEEGDDAAEVDEGGETEGDDEGRDDGDGEEEGPEAEDDVAEPAPRRGGGSQTIRAQRARAQAAERALADKEREIAELRGFQAGATSRQQQPDPQAQARAEQEWWQNYEVQSPVVQAQMLQQRARTEFGGALQQLRFEQQELADQARYDASCARSPTREAYRDKVEQYRAQQRRAGFVIGREEAYHLLLGRDTEARAARARPGQQRAAAARVAGQRTQPTGARSNMAARGRRPQPGSEEADLAAIRDADARGIKIW